MKSIDLRSDTVTLPTLEMLQAMISSPLGDDVFQEDPTVNRLESQMASYFGKEAALFCASGTQTNQIAIMVHTQPGGEVVCHAESHIYKYEGGGIARNSLCSMKLIQGNRGRINAQQLEEAMNNAQDVHLPLTQLVSIEDTANRGGGAVYDFQEIQKIKSFCDSKNLPLHLDGARVFNALCVTGIDPKTYAQAFDSMSVCLSKGLGAPVGSLVIGSSAFIHKARRVRKVLGGGMRQAGILAAAGLYAMEHHIQRIAHDHARAKTLENCLQQQPWVEEVLPVETNIVVAVVKKHELRDQIIEILEENGIKSIAFGRGMIRFVTHLNIDDKDIDLTIFALNKIKIL